MTKLRCFIILLCTCACCSVSNSQASSKNAAKLRNAFFSIFAAHSNSFSDELTESDGVTNVDLLFVMDNSGSISRDDFSKQKSFVALTIDHALTIGCRCSVRVAVITFSTSSQTTIEFDFDDISVYSTPRANLKSAVDSIPYIGGESRNIKGALALAHSLINDASKGARSGADKVVFVVTNGGSTEGGNPETAADVLKESDKATVFVMGPANFRFASDQRELINIATPKNGDREYVLAVDDFNDMRNIAHEFGPKARCNLIDMANNRREDWMSIIEGFKILKKNGVINELAALHSDGFDQGAHRDPGLFPWHRAFLTMLERAIQIARNDDALRLPYWNWAGEKINDSKIWIPLGGAQNGDPPDYCVNTGHFNKSEWHSDPSECIQRNMIGSEQASQSQLDEDQKLSLYTKFRPPTESKHNNLHGAVGGDMASTKSPRDPVFYFHHCFLDRLWYDWQKRHGDGPNNYPSFEGKYTLNSTMKYLSLTYPETTTPLLPQPTWNRPINLLKVTALGYTYDERKSLLQQNGQPPTFHPSATNLSSSQVLQTEANDIQCFFLSDLLSPAQMTECVRRRATPGVRFASGPNEFEGRIEVLTDGAWYSICDAGWSDTNAAVVCRQLGYSGGKAVDSPKYKYQYSSNLLTNFHCRGTESLLQDCSYSKVTPVQSFSYNNWARSFRRNGYCSNYAYAQVQCSPSVRLSTSGRSNGYLQVYNPTQKTWGVVCGANSWGNRQRSTACEAAGYGPSLPRSYRRSGPSLQPLQAANPSCLTSYKKEIDCSTGVQWGRFYCTNPSDRFYVSCQKAVRLVGGSGKSEGRVEVYHSGVWGTVCGRSWEKFDGDVVCRQLGFYLGAETTAISYGPGSGIVWLDQVQCVGNEQSLDKCRHAGYGTNTCNHYEDAAVKCKTAIR
ncbi:uncharacterized protein [Oscarella lobularis]|uniref:uncharacterized protein n=1 Tax=Oscarella lobularis TaxID=121494 RepID=UPI003313B929